VSSSSLSPAERALHGFILTHPGLPLPALAAAYGLPETCCAELCANLAAAGWLRQNDNAGWWARSGIEHDTPASLTLHETAAPLSLLFEQSLDGMFFMLLDEPLRWDEDIDKEQALDQAFQRQRVTQVNEAMCRQYAARPEQLLGLSPTDFFAHDLAEGRRLWRQLFGTGRLHTESDERRFDGTPISIEGDYRCLYDAQGRIIGHFGVQRDVTERQAALHQLAQSEARLRDLIACTADFIWEVDLEGRFTYLSGQLEPLLGYREDELIGQTPFVLMEPDEAERIAALFEQAHAQGTALGNQENDLIGKDGKRRCFAFNGFPIRDEQDAILGYRGLNRDITAQKQAHEALRASEQFLRTVFELSPESIMIIDPLTTLPLHFNRVAHERLGYSAEEFATLRVSDYDAYEDPEAAKRHIERVRRHGRDDFETRHRCRDGRLLNIIVSVQTTVWEGREVLYAMSRDVTELRALNERLLLATRIGGIGIWEWTIGSNSLATNEQMDELYGMPLDGDQQAYSRWLRALHPADRPRIEQQVAQALNANIEFDAEFRILRGDEARWLRAAARIVRDPHGQPTKMVGVNWDITDARRARERIARSEAQFRGAFEIAPNGMALVDASGHWLQVNQALCTILGYTAEELLALDFQSISDPEGLNEDLGYLDALLSGRTDEVRFEKYYIHKDGHRIPVLLSASAVRDEQGGLSFTVAHVLDLTEQRASEAAMLATKEAAEAANRAKSEFLANMSHEIRTPLNAMIGLTDLTLGTALDAQQRDYLEKVRQSSGALLSILNDILDYSKIEAGQIELDPRPFRLRDLLDQLTALFQAAVEAQGLELVYRIAPEVPRELIGDPMRLGQVLNNLVGNAVKFTEQGHVALVIAVEDEREGQVRLRFAVQDTGIGIAPGTAEDLFNAFTQADGSITRRYGGTGLGLSISQRLVSMMGGRIEVESREGHGSRFHFDAWFPLPQGTTTRIGAPPAELARARILLIDKEPFTRDMLSALLGSWQVPLVVADGCAEAHQRIASAAAAGSPIELVLLDAKHCLNCHTCPTATAPIPGAAQPPRTFGHLATPLVLMVTNLEQTQLLARAPASELPPFLTKPVTPAALFEAIASLPRTAPVQPVASSSVPNPASCPAPNAAEPEHPLDETALRGLRILVAEDNAINQIVIQALLQRFGAQVLIAENGREAVELALQHAPDAVLMDLQMPEMDGLEATTRIRAQHPRLPIIALTAAALERDQARCLAAGMNAHLAKPASPAQLLAALQIWVRPAPARAEAAQDAATAQTSALDPQALSELRRAIAHNDYVPPELLARLRPQTDPAAQAQLSRIEEALARFDYDAAARVLDELPAAASPIPVTQLQPDVPPANQN
jgi:PAS domain S-box-containing protein